MAVTAATGVDGAFAALCDRVQACRACARMEGRRRVLGPECGPLRARAVLVGTAPGRHGADRTGIPFSGDRSGALLDRLLVGAGLRRSEVFVTNAVLCNPRDHAGRNAEPSPTEVQACAAHLAATLALVDAPVTVTLGRTAFAAVVSALAGTRDAATHRPRFGDHLGRARPYAGRIVVATYHPSPRVTADPARGAALRAQWAAVATAVSRSPW